MTPHRHSLRYLAFIPIYSCVFIALSACTNVGSQSSHAAVGTPKPTDGIKGNSLIPMTTSESEILSNTTQPLLSEEASSPSFTVTVIPYATATTPPVNTPTAIPADYWMSMPIIPAVSQTAMEIYQRGVSMGRDPHAFSKIGDCQSISTYFLAYFDNPNYYKLGDYTSLQDTIDWYAGSFSRDSLAVKGGFNAAAILTPLRADPKQCRSAENPISCEIRLHNPSVAIISLEEWWAGHPENYEIYLRRIIEYTIQQGIVPIVATKADNLEGNNLINQTIASLALEYDIPMWNFWLAVQPLPNHGLSAYDPFGAVDMFHLTHSGGYYFYDDPAVTQSGWSVRNLTALQVLDAVRRGLTEGP
jgi:hypothetical protein